MKTWRLLASEKKEDKRFLCFGKKERKEKKIRGLWGREKNRRRTQEKSLTSTVIPSKKGKKGEAEAFFLSQEGKRGEEKAFDLREGKVKARPPLLIFRGKEGGRRTASLSSMREKGKGERKKEKAHWRKGKGNNFFWSFDQKMSGEKGERGTEENLYSSVIATRGKKRAKL